MQPHTPAAPHEPADGPADPAPAYIWVVYSAFSSRPFTAHGAAATADDAREEAEDAMTKKPGESDFGVILAHDCNDKIGRPAGDGTYRWTPCRLAGLQP